MSKFNIIYHYYPSFRRQIFESVKELSPETVFIYGRNARFNIASVADDTDHVRHNFFVGTLIFQSFSLTTLRHVLRNDSIILGDIKYLNSWLYAVLGRLFGRKVLFWTHGVLKPEVGLKWMFRRAYYNLANGLLLYSQHEADLMRDQGFCKPIYLVGNANFNTGELADTQPTGQLAGNGLCYIGRISAEKGLNDFINFSQRYPDRKVVLVGPISPEDKEGLTTPENLHIIAPEYDLERLRQVTADCGTMIMFSAAGLSLFTAAFLGKRIVIKRTYPQKPEYNLLQDYDLIETFENFDELVQRIEQPLLSDNDYHKARLRFLENNTAENVAKRIFDAWSDIKALTK